MTTISTMGINADLRRQRTPHVEGKDAYRKVDGYAGCGGATLDYEHMANMQPSHG